MKTSKDVYLVADNKKIFIRTINIAGGYPHWLDSLIPDIYKKKYGNKITNIIIEEHDPKKNIIAVDDLNDNTKLDEQKENNKKIKLIRYNDIDRDLYLPTGTLVTKEIIGEKYPQVKKHNDILEIQDNTIYFIDSISSLKANYKIPDNIKDHMAIAMIEDKLNNIGSCKDDENILNKAIMEEIKIMFYNSGCFSLKDRDVLNESDFKEILNNFICDDTIWNDINCKIYDLIAKKLESKPRENIIKHITQLILSSKSNPKLNFIGSINNILEDYKIVKKDNMD